MTNTRKPRRRAPRSQTARKAALEAGTASKARGLIKRRMVALESRMTVLERLLDSLNSPGLQAIADSARELGDSFVLLAKHDKEEE